MPGVVNDQIISNEEAVAKSTEYFNGDDLAAKVFVDKYALRNNEGDLLESTPDEMHYRIAKEFARVEKKKFKNPLTKEEIFEYLDHFKRIVPQGSPMYGIGNDFQTITLSNCYVVNPPLDSYGGIHKSDEQLTQISKRRGGTGMDISKIRPNGSSTSNAARSSTGIIPFMERYSNSIREVGQSGRRGALMITISCHHPEIQAFANVKRDLTKITGANLSIRLSNEFLEAVDKGKEYELRWPIDAREKGEEPKISRMIDAKLVWNQIIEAAHAVAEPGLLFWDNIVKESPADCYKEFETVSTNPCSEVPLSALDSCRLLLLRMLTYVDDPWTNKAKFNFDSFVGDAEVAQRLMDDLIDLELEKIDAIIKKIKNDPEPEDVKRVELETWTGIRKACGTGRRTGCGVTAVGDTLAALGIPYGSKRAISFINKVYKALKIACYRSSVEMAKELGPFDAYDAKKEKDCAFIKRLSDDDPNLYKDMKKYGRRNIALLTTAPAGSVSILTQTTSGIEPLFKPFYIRRRKVNPEDQSTQIVFIDQNGDNWEEFTVFHPQLVEWAKANGHDGELNEELAAKSPWFENCAEDLDWGIRVQIQATANKHVDHAISSTINLPSDVSLEEVEKIYFDAWKKGCKGITVYRKDCRCGVLVDKESGAKREEKGIVKTHAPKRPKKIPADVHHTSVQGEQYFVLVGMLHGDPYEVFAGKNGFFPKNIKRAIIKKIKRGNYECVLDNGNTINNVSEWNTAEEEALTRMTSCSLRHGADISFIVHQLEKTRGDMTSFAKAISRCLKKHIPDKAPVTGEECESCGSQLVRQDGCKVCKSCGWSACS
jgi:ribonucleoside-diphosphate reductase alpha chain